MNSHLIDETKLNAFFARALGDLSAGYGGVMVSLGSKLGLYRECQEQDRSPRANSRPSQVVPSVMCVSG